MTGRKITTLHPLRSMSSKDGPTKPEDVPSVRRTWAFLESRKWEYLGIIAFAALSWFLGISFYWVIGTWVTVAIVGTIFWRLKPTPKVLTLPEIAKANPDVDRQDLALLFSSGVDIHSKLWLFIAGVIIGLYSTGLPNTLQAEINILGTQTPSLIVTYSLAFLTIVVALVWLT